MNYYFDTEFIEDGHTIDLLSIAMVSEGGNAIYFENAEADLSRANDFVREHVLPHLGPVEKRVSRVAIRHAILDFVGPDTSPLFIAYYAAYDWVALCQLFGEMVDLPKTWPFFCIDLKQELMQRGVEMYQPDGQRHHALDDAMWVRSAWQFLEAEPTARPGETEEAGR